MMTLEVIAYIALIMVAATWTLLTVCRWIAAARDIRRGRLELKPLRPDQYRQVGEWWLRVEGQNPADFDWDGYAAEMNETQWTHYGIYQRGQFGGCLSFEYIDEETLAYHIVTARRKIEPQELRELLLRTAEYHLNRGGFTKIAIQIPKANRATARLALRCGMLEEAGSETSRHFVLTRERHHANTKTKNDRNAVSAI